MVEITSPQGLQFPFHEKKREANRLINPTANTIVGFSRNARLYDDFIYTTSLAASLPQLFHDGKPYFAIAKIF